MGKKATFLLDEQIMSEAKEMVEEGLFKSMNSFVESAIRDEIEKIKKERIRRAVIDASRDPIFLSDIKEIEEEFRHADFEEEK